MSVNRAWLIGHLAAVPRLTPDGVDFLVATVRETRDRNASVERTLVHLTALAEWPVGALLLVEGALTLDTARRRHVVEARRVTVLQEPEPPGPATVSPGEPRTHAAPVVHERAGHFRLVGVRTPRERLVWVRPTTVGGSR